MNLLNFDNNHLMLLAVSAVIVFLLMNGLGKGKGKGSKGLKLPSLPKAFGKYGGICLVVALVILYLCMNNKKVEGLPGTDCNTANSPTSCISRQSANPADWECVWEPSNADMCQPADLSIDKGGANQTQVRRWGRLEDYDAFWDSQPDYPDTTKNHIDEACAMCVDSATRKARPSADDQADCDSVGKHDQVPQERPTVKLPYATGDSISKYYSGYGTCVAEYCKDKQAGANGCP